MSNKNALKGGTDWIDGDILFATDLDDTFDSFYRKVYTDNTGGSISNSTVETDIATITVLQNDLGTSASLSIVASLEGKSANAINTTTFRLYVGGANIKTISEAVIQSQGPYSDVMIYLSSSIDTSAGNIIVKITGQNSQAISSGDSAACNGLIVDGIHNNT